MFKLVASLILFLSLVLFIRVESSFSVEIEEVTSTATGTITKTDMIGIHQANMDILRADRDRKTLRAKLDAKKDTKANWNTVAYIAPVFVGALATVTTAPVTLGVGLLSSYAVYKIEHGRFNEIVSECTTLLNYQDDIDKFDSYWGTIIGTSPDPVPSETSMIYRRALINLRDRLDGYNKLCL